MSTDLIRYDLRVQEALRGVVRRVLTDAARDGISGEHHFYISFATQAEGVRLSSRLRQQYPERMTIVLQHQFWDLTVSEDGFEVGLSFKNIPERLYVPFEALMEFYDPSVQFGLKFENVEGAEGAESEPSKSEPKLPAASVPSLPKPKLADKRGDPEKVKPRGSGSEPAEIRPRPRAVKTEEQAPTPAGGGDKIVSIDSFRKKP
ncbi:MAG: Stringent starvation protein B [Methylobacteriaceae bacterium]|nr:Stringent starvation protein B [Methylobacteriaceae bacterium]